jgi:hypothetical protein
MAIEAVEPEKPTVQDGPRLAVAFSDIHTNYAGV